MKTKTMMMMMMMMMMMTMKGAIKRGYVAARERISRRRYLNLLRWNDVPPHVENFSSQIATFSQFSVYINVTQAKQMIKFITF